MSGLRLIEVRKLAALDMAGLGTRLVLAEYALGIVLAAALGTLSLGWGIAHDAELYQWPVLGGIWLLTIAANYVPLFLYDRAGLPRLRPKLDAAARQVLLHL